MVRKDIKWRVLSTENSAEGAALLETKHITLGALGVHTLRVVWLREERTERSGFLVCHGSLPLAMTGRMWRVPCYHPGQFQCIRSTYCFPYVDGSAAYGQLSLHVSSGKPGSCQSSSHLDFQCLQQGLARSRCSVKCLNKCLVCCNRIQAHLSAARQRQSRRRGVGSQEKAQEAAKWGDGRASLKSTSPKEESGKFEGK